MPPDLRGPHYIYTRVVIQTLSETSPLGLSNSGHGVIRGQSRALATSRCPTVPEVHKILRRCGKHRFEPRRWLDHWSSWVQTVWKSRCSLDGVWLHGQCLGSVNPTNREKPTADPTTYMAVTNHINSNETRQTTLQRPMKRNEMENPHACWLFACI